MDSIPDCPACGSSTTEFSHNKEFIYCPICDVSYNLKWAIKAMGIKKDQPKKG